MPLSVFCHACGVVSAFEQLSDPAVASPSCPACSSEFTEIQNVRTLLLFCSVKFQVLLCVSGSRNPCLVMRVSALALVLLST